MERSAEDCRLIAWCLSLEGSIGLAKQTRRHCYTTVLKLYNTDINIVKSFRELVGVGHIYLTDKHNTKYSKQKDLYIWKCVTISDVREILSQIKDYLPSKKMQAELLIEFLDLKAKYKNRWYSKRDSNYFDKELEIYNELKVLNKRGI